MEITINGVQYILKSGHAFLRCLCTLLGLPGIDCLIGKINTEKGAGKSLDICVDLIRASVAVSHGIDPGTDTVKKYLEENPEKVDDIIGLLVDNLPPTSTDKQVKPKKK